MMARKTWTVLLEGGITIFQLLTTKLAFASNGDLSGSGNLSVPNPFGQSCTDIQCPINAIINFAYMVALPLCAIIVLWGGFQMATAAGNPEKFGTGKKTLLYAAAGFIVILLAKGASQTIKNFLGQ